METKIKKITSVLLLAIMIIAMASVPVLATTNEKVILKNSNNEYLIYFKEFCKKDFQFAISKNDKAVETELNFVNSAKDQPASSGEALNVAYIDETSFEGIFGKNPTSLVAYIWVKDADDKTVIKAEKIDLSDALTEKMIAVVNTTTKANESTDRIAIDTTQEQVTNPVVEGITTTVRTGKIVVKEKKDSKYYYSLIKVSDENADATEMYNLAETIGKSKDTYENLSAEKRFYELYEKLTPAESDWTEVENSEILQPETARTGDKYIAYIKEENGQQTTVDAKLLVSKYDYEEKRVKEEDKVITETVKLPVTFDSGAILFTVLGIIVIALAIFVFIIIKSNKKDENK